MAGAGKRADELERNNPLDARVQNDIVPTVRAQNQLHQGRAADAVRTLQKTLAMELSSAEVAPMEPTYGRGMAYLQLDHDSLAAGEFQTMIDHRGTVRNFVTGALAHLQWARAGVRSATWKWRGRNIGISWRGGERPSLIVQS
jgi:hypothetical protein